MEIEVDGRALLRWLVGIVIVAGLLFALSNGGGPTAVRLARGFLRKGDRVATPGNVSSDGRSTPAPAQSAAGKATPEPGPTPVIYSVPGRPTLVFEDLSSKWDWTVNEQCLPKLLDWLRGDKWIKGHDFDKLTIGLVDEKAPEKLRLGPKGQEYDLVWKAGLPEISHESFEYLSASGCVVKNSEIRCYVSPLKWDELRTQQLATTVLVASLSALEQLLRPKTMETWNEYSTNWSYSNYEPLVRREEGKWLTDCLEVGPQG